MGSITIFIVQPHKELLPENTTVALPQRAFSRLEDAEAWASDHFPLDMNPLEQCYYEDGDILTVYVLEDEEYDEEIEESDELQPGEVSLKQLRAITRSLGLTLPQSREMADDAWRDWWRANAARMSVEQKTTLWRFLAPNPWKIFEVELEK